ncbi:MAG: glycerol-3-phosphate dehydrogenase/oxidase [Arenimonas sp.]
MRTDFEVGVIGGGILGVGAAQACAAAGYRCVVVEQTDWAAGTSSRSSKLIHGGLRYLESRQFSLVRESLRERAILLRIAPHLVKPLAFRIPVYATTRRRPWELAAGLGLYAVLAGWTALARFSATAPGRLPRSLAASGLKAQGLQTVFRYWDAQTDDVQLTRAVLASAQSLGTQTFCPARLVSAERMKQGYRLMLDAGGKPRELHCDYLVNCGGPWINEVLARFRPEASHRPIDRVLGSHLVIEPAVHADAFYLESPVDQRAVFVLPWKGRTLLGTTERPFEGDPGQAAVSDAEREYLLATLRHYFPEVVPRIVSEFAGVRVLPHGDGRAFQRPRDCVFHVDPRHPNLISLYGGKLTGYRHTGQDVVAKVRQSLGPRDAVADTATLRLPEVS